MKNLLLILATIGAIAGGRYIYSAIQTKQVVDSLNNPTTAPVITEAEAKKEFLSGCSTFEYEGQAEYCGCLYDQIRNTYSINQLASDGINLTQSEMQAKYQKEIEHCLTVVYGSEGV